MTNRLIPALAFPTALAVTGLIFAVLSHGSADHRTAAAAPDAIPVLPLVVVRPEPEIPVLASLTVRPTRAELEAAGVVRRGDDSAERDVLVRELLTGGGLDMPYYSFGKAQHRVSKE